MKINDLTFRYRTVIDLLVGCLAIASTPAIAQQLDSPRSQSLPSSLPSGIQKGGFDFTDPASPNQMNQRPETKNQRRLYSPPTPSRALAPSRSRPSFRPTQPSLGSLSPEQKKLNNAIQFLKEVELDADKQKAKSEIKKMLEEQYDAYLDRHEEPLKQLEKRLEGLRKEFEARKAAKDDLVKLRLDTIWYQSQGLGWPEYHIPPASRPTLSQPYPPSNFTQPGLLQHRNAQQRNSRFNSEQPLNSFNNPSLRQPATAKPVQPSTQPQLPAPSTKDRSLPSKTPVRLLSRTERLLSPDIVGSRIIQVFQKYLASRWSERIDQMTPRAWHNYVGDMLFQNQSAAMDLLVSNYKVRDVIFPKPPANYGYAPEKEAIEAASKIRKELVTNLSDQLGEEFVKYLDELDEKIRSGTERMYLTDFRFSLDGTATAEAHTEGSPNTVHLRFQRVGNSWKFDGKNEVLMVDRQRN